MGWKVAEKAKKIADFQGDSLLLGCVVALAIIGLTMVLSSSIVISALRYEDEYYLFLKQLLFIVLGIGVLPFLMRLSPRFLRGIAYPLIILSFILLVALFIPGVGTRINHALRWIRLGIFSFQPAEFAKIAVIFYLAAILAKKDDLVRDFKRGIIPVVLVLAVFQGVLLLQPDFGSVVVLSLCMLFMLFVSGARIVHLFLLVLPTLVAFYFLILNVDYRRKRVLAFLDPWQDPLNTGFQMVQSLLAFHNGGVSGVGFGDGRQKMLYLPEAHTDFIFSVIGEEFGLIGCTIIVLLFAVVFIRSIKISFALQDPFEKYLCAGLAFLLAVQAVFNMGVVLGLLPTKGLALPFLSYGGSSVLFNFFAIGIILNLSGRSGCRTVHS